MAGRSRLMRSEAARGWAMISPPAIYALLLLAVPLATIVWLSFISQTGVITYDYTPTLQHYRNAITDPLYQSVMARSIMVSLSVTFATVVLAFPVAYFVSFHVPASRKSRWLFLITIPFWTSYLIRMSLWQVILGYSGAINSGLIALGLIEEPLQIINYNVGAMILSLAHAYAPFAILPIFVALEKIDRSLLEASTDLGEGKVMTFLRVTLPLAMPGVMAAILIVFIPTIGDFVTPKLIGGPSNAMIANWVYANFFDLTNRPQGAALAIVAMALAAGISMLFILANRIFVKGPR